MSDDQQTNQPTYAKTYLSLRINLPHERFDELVQNVIHDVDYVAYPHKGKQGSNEHFHVFIPTDTRGSGEKFRNRIKRWLGGGNQKYSIKYFDNGFDRAIQYGSKEGTCAFVSNDDFRILVDNAPPWIPQDPQRRLDEFFSDPTKDSKKERDWQLTYSNLVCQAVQHARRSSMTTSSLKEVVAHMIETTKWRPSYQLINKGVPEFYSHDYEQRLGKRAKCDMSWWTPRF